MSSETSRAADDFQPGVAEGTDEGSAIVVEGVSKVHHLYDAPHDRLKQFFIPRGRELLGLPPSKHFSEFRALDDISFTVRKGETVGIIGRNGSGKSTLLQIICGTLTPSSGQVRVNGRVAALLELGSGFNPEFTGRDNVFLNAGLLGLSTEQTAAKFPEIEAFADIGEFIDQPVKTYSSGMMVRLAFAVIAHVDADILVIDEALAVGDAFFTQKCMRFLREFMKRGTILFVSHDSGAIKNLCSDCIWLESGQVFMQGSPKEVCERYLRAFFEVEQGAGTTTRLRGASPRVEGRDQRLAYINASNLRNDLQIFDFDPEADSFGQGGATITQVSILDENGDPLAWAVGGEPVRLHVAATCQADLAAPIIGFYIKDRLGQTLFGDNTYLSYAEQPVPCRGGETVHAIFHFDMPRLASGDYTVTAALADGTQEEHVMHHWIHDALHFKAVASSVAVGLIGIPMRKITLESADAQGSCGNGSGVEK